MSVMVVAELSGNHLGYKARAMALVEAAHRAGADAIKLQTFSPQHLAGDNPAYTTLISGPWKGRTLFDLYTETCLPWAWHRSLFEYARDLGMECFSSPFHPGAVDFLETLDCPRYKVASFEVGDIPLLERIAATQKPVIMSTGVADDDDIDRALEALGACPVTLLHCISEYPANPLEMNLRRMTDLGLFAPHAIGLSDHSLTPTAAICAVALGATVIEKHLTMSRASGGPDAGFSLEPSEFAETVRMIRHAEGACLTPTPQKPAAESSYASLRKSVWVIENVAKGDRITPENTRVLRPGDGIPPSMFKMVQGLRFARDVAAGSPLTYDAYEGAG